ncbi:LIM domain-containing protein [Rhizoctonia solani AG-1 IA]|uniref:LIM domain-containing protein n=1 Tax=Thanatephorus cucumeris (strain AG1-IA) TaxID=983506 RepID=L8WTS9_THACA|nr:LIM domain-containing protein [Rhizoctonia solani AG-1 IA]
MGFCARCGDLVNSQTSRCKCGGRPRNGSVQVSPGIKDGNTDRWSKTYTSKEKTSTSASTSSSNRNSRNSSGLPPLGMLTMDFNKDDDVSPPPRTPPPSDALGTSHTNLAALPPVQRSPGRRSFPKPLNHSSRVSSRPTTTNRPSSPLKQAYIPPKHDSPPISDRRDQYITDDDDMPSIADEDLGDLTNTLGSTIQPKETLPVQLCASCDEPFATDAVRYPGLDDPRGITGVFYCRQCFKDNGGLKGHCAACGNEVLMGRHDGSSVTVREKLFHSKCFKCTHCGNKVDRGHSCDPAGKPCCEPCLEKILNTPSGPSPPSTTRITRKSGGLNESTSEDRRTSTPRGPPPGSNAQSKGNTSDSAPPARPRESMSFLEELKQRQSAGGGAPSPSAIRRETLRSRSKSRDAERQPVSAIDLVTGTGILIGTRKKTRNVIASGTENGTESVTGSVNVNASAKKSANESESGTANENVSVSVSVNESNENEKGSGSVTVTVKPNENWNASSSAVMTMTKMTTVYHPRTAPLTPI